MDWPVAFQMEGLVRSGLVTTDDILKQLKEPISKLCKEHASHAADVIRYFRNALCTSQRSEATLLKTLEHAHEIVAASPLAPLQPGTFICYHLLVAPTRWVPEGPFVNRSNRVLRKYQGFESHFMRVEFRDEDRQQYRWDKECDGRPFLIERVGGTLKDGFKIAGRKYNFLAYSNSALR